MNGGTQLMIFEGVFPTFEDLLLVTLGWAFGWVACKEWYELRHRYLRRQRG